MMDAPPLPSKVEYSGMTAQAHHTLERVIESQRNLDYPALASDDYFEIFASSQVLKLLNFNVDPEEIELGIVGGGNDGGIDGFYVFANRLLLREETEAASFKGQQIDITVVVVQAKNKVSFEESVPMKFKDFVDNCFSAVTPTPEAVLLYSSALLDAVAKFHKLYDTVLHQKPTLKVSFFHAAHSEIVDEKVHARYRLLDKAVKAAYPNAEYSYKPVTGTQLIKLSQKREEEVLQLRCPQPFSLASFARDAYISVARLGDYYDFMSGEDEVKEFIFEGNVRDYSPDATVNEAIERTLSKPENDDFWWLNNGVTILASDAIYRGGFVHITNPTVVNGLQSSHALFRHIKGGGSKDDLRSIMVKIIVNQDEETSNRIIRATNSQTKINSIFLHATEQIHRNIELSLKHDGFLYDRRKNYYRNRGASVGEIVTIPYLAQAVSSIVLQLPNDARVRPGTVAEKHYAKLFSESYPLEHYTKCIQILRRCYSFLGTKSGTKTDVLNRVFYLAMYVAAKACKTVKPRRQKIAELVVDSISNDVFEDCYQWIEAEFIKLGGDDRTAKGSSLAALLKQHIIEELGRKPKPRRGFALPA